MNRKLFLRYTVPSVVIGLFFFAGCLISIRYIHRLNTNLARILDENVASLQAAQELEIQVRQLRYHTFMYLLDPKPTRLPRIDDDERKFEEVLDRVRQASTSKDERTLVTAIEGAFRSYKADQDRLRTNTHGHPLADAYKLDESHGVRLVVKPCQDLLTINKEKMGAAALESQRVSQEGYMAMLFMGLAGPIGGLVIGYGVTRGLRQQQRELVRTEQLAQVGQLAAGVAHEIRNPLTGIKLLVEAALRPQSPRTLNQEDLQMIFREVKRLEKTVQQFLNFARLPAPQTAPCDLCEIIRQAWEPVQVRAKQQLVDPVFHLPSEAVVVSVDAAQLTTVLVNLFLNALDSMGQGGHVEVYLSKPDSHEVLLKVCDTGPGIPAKIKSRLFQPFATNKTHGTGLGLFLTRRILEEHGGSADADNRPEGGACFTLTLPIKSRGGKP